MADYNNPYEAINWVDHVEDELGNVLVQGTPLSALEHNRMEAGIDLSNNVIGAMLAFVLQEVNAIKLDRDKDNKQRLMQDQGNITGDGSTDLTDAYPYVLISLPEEAYSLINAPNYDVVISLLSADDEGKVGELIAYDKTQNGFKVKITGSATNVNFMWTVVNPRIK